MIREYLKDNLLIADGAMGTYYSQVTGKNSLSSELANSSDPEIIERIHAEYIEAGARLIRTNTFSVNSVSLKITREEARRLLIKGYEIAKRAVGQREIFIAADIGPIPETVSDSQEVDNISIFDEYKFIVDTFLEIGADIFVFETFSSTDFLEDITKYIKDKNKSAFILAQFATTPDGYTRKGISNDRIIKEVKSIKSIDAYGFNCGVGPTHLYNSLNKLDFKEDTVAVFPNSGYPEIVNERTIYIQNPDYFAEIMKNVSKLGVRILGGCCGTTPVHIRKMAAALGQDTVEHVANKPLALQGTTRRRAIYNGFSNKLKNDKFVVAVELDPPFDAGIEKILQSAWICKENGVDIITIADSPMARARVDSVMLAAKIKREVGIDTMPHVCCRDKNLNALKSSLLAGYIEGIRNILAVTGDSIASSDKSEIKSVFNLNSLKLIQLISDLNREVFAEDHYHVGGALNLNVVNKDAEVSRMYRKAEKGASFFLTQPVFATDVIGYLPTIKRNQNIKILGGIMPLVSYRNAQFLNNEMPGIQVPEDYLNRFDKNMIREDAENLGIELAVEIAGAIKRHVDGFYFITPFNRIEMIIRILKQCGISE